MRLQHFSTALLLAVSMLSMPLSCKTVPPSEAPDTDVFPSDNETMSPETAGIDEDPTEPVSISEYLVRLPESEFREVWGYVLARNEKSLKPGYPVSDIVYFGAEVDQYGSVVNIPNRKNLPHTDSADNANSRVHISIVCGSAGLTHFLLEPESKARLGLVKALIAMTRDYDGLNIDFENVPLQDADHFLSLLRELKDALGEKVLSVCVPARDTESKTYNYKNIAGIADRVFVMAYDEHWAGSAPGPVASMGWCRSVASYALKTIGAKKLVMGIPFYGRSWADTSTARALTMSTTDTIMKDRGIGTVQRENGIPKFTYEVNVGVTVYFEDAYSLATRMDMYRNLGVDKIGFWRIGQEDTAVWDYIKISATAE
jgi:spore germination protein YaaH